MPRRRSKKGTRPLKEVNQHENILQTNKIVSRCEASAKRESGSILEIESPICDENCLPSSSSRVDELNDGTAALYSELDSFRQRWKRELEETKQTDSKANYDITSHRQSEDDSKPIDKEKTSSSDNDKVKIENFNQIYAEAKKLFLTAVKLEQDEVHYPESIRYYKKAMHLYPDIEKRIFQEQCEASLASGILSLDKSEKTVEQSKDMNPGSNSDGSENVQLYDKISRSFHQDNLGEGYAYCRPNYKPKQGTLHISDLPPELIMQIYRHVIGDDLDLSSLESVGLVCRGFYLLSKDPSLWRSICYSTWDKDTLTQNINDSDDCKLNKGSENQAGDIRVDWRKMFLERPRVNFDGVYISKTRYIRQGDVGFQDITYRPFHVVQYCRYLRFFPDRRVLILTTNEEPDKIIPIFRHAMHSTQFSSDLSILEGTYEFVNTRQILVVAEKDCRSSINLSLLSHRGQAQYYWSRQTPISQRFSLRFELKTIGSKPYKNNVLKWSEYTILSRLETGQELTSLDLCPDTFPNMNFSRVKRFNLRSTNPLTSH